MHLRYALLALLAEGEAHGYALVKRFNDRLGPFWQPNVGQVYQLLHALAARGLVVPHDVRGGVRRRRSFALTTRGERSLHAWLARRPGWPPPLRDEILVRCLAAEREGVPAVLAQLERQEAEYRRYVALVEDELARTVGASLTRRVAREAAQHLVEAQLRWLGRCRELLRADGVSSRASG